MNMGKAATERSPRRAPKKVSKSGASSDARVPPARPPAFDRARSLIEACELAVARGRPTQARLDTLTRLANKLLPIELVVAAARPGLAAFAWWCVLLLGGATLAYAVARPLAWFSPTDVDSWYLAYAYLVTFCFVLARPSATAFPGWSVSDLDAAKGRIPSLATLTTGDVTDMRYFLAIAESSSRRRIVALWWIAGSVWALSAWLAQKGFKASDGNLLGTALVPLLFCLFLAGLIAAYTRAVGHVYGLSHALLVDREAALARTAEARLHRLRRGTTDRRPRR